MITTFFFGLLKIMINAISLMIPNWLVPDIMQNGFLSIIESALSVNGFLPMKAIFYSLNTILLFHITVWTINAVGGLISIIRGGGNIKV